MSTDRMRTHATGSRHIAADPGLTDSKAYNAWFRGKNAPRMPKRGQMVSARDVRDRVLAGWTPDAPAITRDTRVTAFGSCFAAKITNYLARRGYSMSSEDADASDAYVVRIGEGMVNTFVIRQQFEWAWEGKAFGDGLWYAEDGDALEADEKIRLLTKDIFDRTEVFVLTLGLSEVWYDKVTDEVALRVLPRSAYDPERHSFRVTTVEENRDNIERIYQLIRKHAPEAKVIVTLSPIPLSATFRDQSCISANAVSKSILRVAVDEVVRQHMDEGVLHYWPSYEIVMATVPDTVQDDGRHVRPSVSDFIMTQFEHVWCDAGQDGPPDLDLSWIEVLSETGMLPKSMRNAARARRAAPIRELLDRGRPLHRSEEISAALRAYLDEVATRLEAEEAAEMAAEMAA
ncbi:MAG: GSCFA domain-containing protein [Paracoccaceae bacterium]